MTDVRDFWQRYSLVQRIPSYKNSYIESDQFMDNFIFGRCLTDEDIEVIYSAIDKAVMYGKFIIADAILNRYISSLHNIYNNDMIIKILQLIDSDKKLLDNNYKNIKVPPSDYIDTLIVLIKYNYPINKEHITFAKSRTSKFVLFWACCCPIGIWEEIYLILKYN